MEFERELHEILTALELITKAGVIEMLFRLRKEETKIGDFLRKYRMHSQTAKEASEILLERVIITIRKEGRKKILSITDKGLKLVHSLEKIKDVLFEELIILNEKEIGIKSKVKLTYEYVAQIYTRENDELYIYVLKIS